LEGKYISKICPCRNLVYADQFSFCPFCGKQLLPYDGIPEFRSTEDYNNYLLEKIDNHLTNPNIVRVKTIRAFWNAGKDIILGLIGGLFGALISIYFIKQEVFKELVVIIIIMMVILFFVYRTAKDDIPF
jgi:hypothetical protein